MADVAPYYKDREVLVTGCSSGMGAAASQMLREPGRK